MDSIETSVKGTYMFSSGSQARQVYARHMLLMRSDMTTDISWLSLFTCCSVSCQLLWSASEADVDLPWERDSG